MSNYNDDSSPDRSRRLTEYINDCLEEMHVRRAEYRRAKSIGPVTPQTQARFQSSVVSVYDEFYPLRKEVKSKWEKYKLEKLNALAGIVNSEINVKTEGGQVDYSIQEDPYRILCQDLLMWSRCLDDIAKDLGFEPDVSSSERKLYTVKNPEEYDEPVKKGIPKPQ